MAYEKMVDLVLTGDVMPGFDLLSVKSSLARTFKRSAVEVEHLFTSVPFTVKRDLPESQLQGYLDLFANIGAVVRIAPASSAVALIGAHAAKPDDAPLGGTTARRAPPPFTATEPLGPEAGDAQSAGAPDVPVQMTCPKCGRVQPRRTLCLECGTDMPRYAQAQAEMVAPEPQMPQYAAPQAVVYPEADHDLPPLLALSVTGRIGRLRYLAWGIPALLAFFAAMLVLLVGLGSGRIFSIVLGLGAFLAGLVVLLRVSILRLHDLGRSGWWVLMFFVPLLNLVTHLVLMLAPGEPVANEHGPVPEDNTAAVYAGAGITIFIYLLDLLPILRLRH